MAHESILKKRVKGKTRKERAKEMMRILQEHKKRFPFPKIEKLKKLELKERKPKKKKESKLSAIKRHIRAVRRYAEETGTAGLPINKK